MRNRGSLAAWIPALAALAAPLAAQNPNDDILKRVARIEERLQRLEEDRQKPAAQTGEQHPGGEAGTVEQQKTVEIDELRRQVDVLAEELEKMRSGEKELPLSPRETQSRGVASSAAAVYRKQQGVSLAGYGEMLYQNFDSRDESGSPVDSSSQIDFLRAILYAGYRFNDKFLFNSEIEFEHGSTDKAGEISVEFAYIDYLASKHLSLRGGLLLIPMGLTNEFHEPNVFIGARRPETERRIIPTTWRENGFGIAGSAGIFDFRAYLVNGLDASGFESEGLREGSQLGSEAKAEDFAFVGRLDVHPTPGAFFGGSLYRGGSGQGQFEFEGRRLDVTTTIGELHGQVQMRGFDLRGLYARASLDDVAELNRARGLEGEESIAETLQGGYLQFGYNLLARTSEQASLMPYYRFEKVGTQHEVAAGFLADPANDRLFHTLGLEYKPIRNIVFKADFQWNRNQAHNGVNQFNLAMGYAF